MPQQVLQIDPPHELVFKGPFTDVKSNQLKLTNPSDRQVCFKVKTTAPKQYCVRPNSGLIPPNGVVNVAIMLQPFDFTAEDQKSKHKFMVQTVYVPDGETSLDNIFKNIQPEDLMDSKLRVAFEMPDTNNVDRATPAKSLPTKPVGGNEQEADLRRLVDDSKRLESKLRQLEQENEQLRTRLSKSENSAAHQRGDGSVQSAHQLGEIKLTHIVLAALIALFIGVIFGKAF